MRCLTGGRTYEDEAWHGQTETARPLAECLLQSYPPDLRRTPHCDSWTSCRFDVPECFWREQPGIQVQFACKRVGDVQGGHQAGRRHALRLLVENDRLPVKVQPKYERIGLHIEVTRQRPSVRRERH